MAYGRQEGDDRSHGHGDDQRPGDLPKAWASACATRAKRAVVAALPQKSAKPTNGVRTQGRSFDLAKVIWYFSISNPYDNADHDQDAF